MALFNVSVWQRSRITLQWFIINLVGSLACLTAVALAQFEWSEGVSGSVSIPDVAFTCLGNLAVFITVFMRGRLDMENGARDVLATTRGPKINAINGCGLTTLTPGDQKDVDVVMLSKYNERPHSSLTQFMQYISHSHALESILLQFSPFTSDVSAERCKCPFQGDCRCVVFRATKEIMIMLAHRLPGTLKPPLPQSQCLLPSLTCLRNDCHACNQGLLYVNESSELETSERRLPEDNQRVDSAAAAVYEALNESLIEEESSCICIPVHPGNADRWTKFMIKFLKSKEKEAKGIKVVVSDALQHYITHSVQELGSLFQTLTGCIGASEIYESASLILPRVAEVIVNMVLTGWLRVDGFSSSLVARRAIRDHVVDSAGTGFGANAFLTEAVVFCSADGTNVCQVLWFRGGILSARRVSYMVGCVNLICSITWSVLIACEDNWAPSMPLSTRRLAVIIGAVGVALGMDCFEVYGGKVRALFRAGAEGRAGHRAEAVAWARARARGWAVATLEAVARDHALNWSRAEGLARVPLEVEVPLEARAEAVARVPLEVEVPLEARAEAVARAEAGAVARAVARAEAGAWAGAVARVEVRSHHFDELLVNGLARDGAQTWAEAEARHDPEHRVRARAEVLSLDLARARARARAGAQDRAWAWGLVPVVILEVGCIVSLAVTLSMNKGVGRWVYSGMQVLVWVKWGIGSFLLGDKATEGEDGSPYFRIRNRGTWVYCSAFLLNAMLAGVRRKWVYSI